MEFEHNYSDAGDSSFGDEDDDPFAELDAATNLPRRNYLCVDASELRSLQDEEVKRVSETLSCKESDAAVLLRTNEWNTERVINAYFEDPQRVLEKAGVFTTSRGVVVDSKSAPFRCPICLDKCSQATALGCGHVCCTDCFTKYIVHKIDDEGPACVRARCPSCPAVVTAELVERLVPADYAKKYAHFLEQSYVEDNPKYEYCPSVTCSRVVQLLQRPDADVPGAVAVTCDCGECFCFLCRKADHSPASCEQLSKWLVKCKDDSETYNWLQANTRTCPQCKTAIEKNGGCNHMCAGLRGPCARPLSGPLTRTTGRLPTAQELQKVRLRVVLGVLRGLEGPLGCVHASAGG